MADSNTGISSENCRGLINQTPAKIALVIGSEATGVSPAVAAKADQRIKIPLALGADSLNAAVSGGILMYLFRPKM